jgi:hypothetical protein
MSAHYVIKIPLPGDSTRFVVKQVIRDQDGSPRIESLLEGSFSEDEADAKMAELVDQGGYDAVWKGPPPAGNPWGG